MVKDVVDKGKDNLEVTSDFSAHGLTTVLGKRPGSLATETRGAHAIFQ